MVRFFLARGFSCVALQPQLSCTTVQGTIFLCGDIVPGCSLILCLPAALSPLGQQDLFKCKSDLACSTEISLVTSQNAWNKSPGWAWGPSCWFSHLSFLLGWHFVRHLARYYPLALWASLLVHEWARSVLPWGFCAQHFPFPRMIYIRAELVSPQRCSGSLGSFLACLIHGAGSSVLLLMYSGLRLSPCMVCILTLLLFSLPQIFWFPAFYDCLRSLFKDQLFRKNTRN